MKIICTALLLSGLSAGAALSQDAARPAVVELYTSQGCSSCPAADELLTKLAQRDDVIALALHVNYWDYIGWTDTFGSQTFTDRQRAYAWFASEKMVYTPQMVVNGGKDKIVGDDAAALAQKLAAAGGHDGPHLELGREGATLRISAKAIRPLVEPARIELVRYIPSAAVDIDRGENAGRRIVYSNIVTSWKTVGEWDGTEPLDMEVDATGDQPAVVLIQEKGPGTIFAAAVSR